MVIYGLEMWELDIFLSKKNDSFITPLKETIL